MNRILFSIVLIFFIFHLPESSSNSLQNDQVVSGYFGPQVVDDGKKSNRVTETKDRAEIEERTRDGKPGNQVSSTGANTVGVNQGDMIHTPGQNGRPSGVEPPRLESKPDVASAGKVPASVSNQTTYAVSSGSGSILSRIFG